jgi:hypothetical protein
VVQLALDGVPVKFGYVGVESDVPVETLLAEEVKQKTERDSNTPVFRRVYPGMFNSVNGSRQSIRDIIYNGSNYCISTWSENDEPPNASKVIWANLVTKEPAKRFEER